MIISALVLIGSSVVVFGPSVGFTTGPSVFIALSGISLILNILEEKS